MRRIYSVVESDLDDRGSYLYLVHIGRDIVHERGAEKRIIRPPAYSSADRKVGSDQPKWIPQQES
ncbi:hypothetical protein KKC97_07695 [bacterium]|nr:hypothetical protein [bacterium]MBU1637536.1 hypothetical protein [bacterium]RQV99727.1 MAG: hypothetical protein EH220_00980 [bacterium]